MFGSTLGPGFNEGCHPVTSVRRPDNAPDKLSLGFHMAVYFWSLPA